MIDLETIGYYLFMEQEDARRQQKENKEDQEREDNED